MLRKALFLHYRPQKCYEKHEFYSISRKNVTKSIGFTVSVRKIMKKSNGFTESVAAWVFKA